MDPVLGKRTIEVPGLRERRAPKKFPEGQIKCPSKLHSAKLSECPLIFKLLVFYLASASLVPLKTYLCECRKQRFFATIDLKHYSACKQLAEQPHTKPATTYKLHALKRKTATFMATVCKATIHSTRINSNFLHMLKTVPSSETKILSKNECRSMYQTLACFGNPIKKEPISESQTL